MKIAFDIGGVLSKYPHIFRPLLEVFANNETEPSVDVFIISDMHPKQKMVDMLRMNGLLFIPEDHILSADYATYGEGCKAILCKQHNIDILIDDFPGYLADGNHVRLLVMPNTKHPYYHNDWKTDGTEGNFGRRTCNE